MVAHPPTLESRGTWLRGWRAEDASPLRSLYDGEVLRWGLAPRQRSEAALRYRITSLADQELALGRRIRLAICHPCPEEVVGAIDLLVGPEAPSCAEVAFLLGPGARGRRLASHAVWLLSRWALTEGGFERVHLLAHPANFASHRVAVRAGFQRVAATASAGPRNPSERILFARPHAPEGLSSRPPRAIRPG